MALVTCPICGGQHPKWQCHQAAAPEGHHSNALAPSPRKPHKGDREPRQALSRLPDKPEPAEPPERPAPLHGKLDTKPSVTNTVTNMTDEQLAPYYNEVMRRKMRSRRARAKESKE